MKKGGKQEGDGRTAAENRAGGPGAGAAGQQAATPLNFQPGTKQKLGLRRPPSPDSTGRPEEAAVSHELGELRDWHSPSEQALAESGAATAGPPPTSAHQHAYGTPAKPVKGSFKGVDPAEFAAKYGYDLPQEHRGRIQVEPGGKSKGQALLPMVRAESLEPFKTVEAPSAQKGVDPAEFADRYGYGLPQEHAGQIKVEPGGKSGAQALRSPIRTQSLGSEQGHFEKERSPIPRRRVDPEEFADKYGYGLPQEHPGQIKVEKLPNPKH